VVGEARWVNALLGRPDQSIVDVEVVRSTIGIARPQAIALCSRANRVERGVDGSVVDAGAERPLRTVLAASRRLPGCTAATSGCYAMPRWLVRR
jgi:hypothetical protein